MAATPCVEPAREEDVPRVIELYVAYRAFYKQPDPSQGTADFIRERISKKDAQIAVARVGASGVVGMSNSYTMPDPAALRPRVLLSDLFVDPAGRGAGAGAALMRAAEASARDAGASCLVLRTAVDNAPGQALYAKCGYRQQAEEQSPWDWPGQADAVAADPGVVLATAADAAAVDEVAAVLARIHGTDGETAAAFLRSSLDAGRAAVMTPGKDVVGLVCPCFGSNCLSRTYLLWAGEPKPESLPQLLAAARGFAGAAEPLRLDAPGAGPVADALRGLGASRTDAFLAFRRDLA